VQDGREAGTGDDDVDVRFDNCVEFAPVGVDRRNGTVHTVIVVVA
jgi:hypothetical protein